MKGDKSLLTTGEIARYCRVIHLTVANWIRAGKLSTSRTPGGHRRVPREDFLRFLRAYNFPIPPELMQEGRRILVVDDDRLLVSVMVRALRDEGYQVSVAFDGYEAGLKMATLKPDLLVLDLIMPGVDGFSVCRRVRADPELRRAKILAITGFVQEGNVAKALECGADRCLEKPFQIETLKAAVGQLLGGRSSETGGGLSAERRRSPRIPRKLQVTWTLLRSDGETAGEAQQGKTINVCREGLRLAMDQSPEPFTLAALQLFLKRGRKPIDALGEVRWVRERRRGGKRDVGIEFISIPVQQQELWGAEIYTSR